MERKKSSLVIVYHRQPYEEVKEKGKVLFKENKSPNGIVPALKGFFGEVERGCWVAWKQVSAKEQGSFEKNITINDSFGEYDVVRLPLTAEQVKSFYHVTSKEALWPTLHSFPWLYNYDAVDWNTFREVNRLFAEAACAEAADDAIIWVHDYNLWLVPAFIRKIKPNVKIAFFHHTPFPAADVFNILPWREEILDSLLDSDIVGFHIPRYSENFAGVARSLRGAEISKSKAVEEIFTSSGLPLSEPTVVETLKHNGRERLIATWPIGTNTNIITEHLSSFDAGSRIAQIKNEIQGMKFIFSVGRVDYTKGTKEMLEAFDRLLERRKELIGKIKFFVVCVAPAKGMTVYKAAQRDIESLVGSINGKYGTLGWTPIMLSTRPIPFDELVSYYKTADVCWITPLRDGLNLVAKEYIASKASEPGALILSEFTGAAVELSEAIYANPYSGKDMDEAIDRAIDMSDDEASQRMELMYEKVKKWDVTYWANHITEQFKLIKNNFKNTQEAVR